MPDLHLGVPDAGRNDHRPLEPIDISDALVRGKCRHWESWINQKLPALGGKAPKEAITSPDGREAVEALLQDAERDRGQDPFTTEANRKGTRRARKLLGFNDQ